MIVHAKVLERIVFEMPDEHPDKEAMKYAISVLKQHEKLKQELETTKEAYNENLLEMRQELKNLKVLHKALLETHFASEQELLKLKGKIKILLGELADWKYELAYFTKEDTPTAKGVASFIKELMDNCSKK